MNIHFPNVQAQLLPTAPDDKANPVTAPLAQEVQPPSQTPRGRELDAAPCSAFSSNELIISGIRNDIRYPIIKIKLNDPEYQLIKNHSNLEGRLCEE